MKNFSRSKNINENYCAVAVRVGMLSPIYGKDRIKIANIGGRNVIVGLEWNEGDEGVFFPMKTVLDPQLLRSLNLYSKVENNADPKAKKGFFDERGYVRMLKLGNVYSEGFILKYEDLAKVYPEFKTSHPQVGDIFDMVGDSKIAWKYEKPITQHKKSTNQKIKKTKGFNRLIPDQFAFHYDTNMLVNNLHNFMPNSEITITVKVHGTSMILANVLTKRRLNLWEKFKKKIGCKIDDTVYDVLYASRKVIKNEYISKNKFQSPSTDGVYDAVYRDFAKYIPKGWTVYGEIAGYKEGTTSFIQKNHDYGCKPGELLFMPYRITFADIFGTIYEMPVKGVIQWTKNLKARLEKENPTISKKLMVMNLIYSGLAGDMYNLWTNINNNITEKDWEEAVNKYTSSNQYNPEYDMPEHLKSFDNFKVWLWRNRWIDAMKTDGDMIGMEKKEPLCNLNVPREGIVIRFVCNTNTESKARLAFKLKSQAHYNREMIEDDNGGSEFDD